MNKYYALLLNNCYDIGRHYISTGECTMVPYILTKDDTNLERIKEDFLELDDTICVEEDHLTIFGSFPVIGTEIDGKIYDVITNKEIKYAKKAREVRGLSYSKKYPANEKMVELLLNALSEESIEKYNTYIKKIEEYYANNKSERDYYLVKIKTIRCDSLPLLVENINGDFIDLVTKEKIYFALSDEISSHLSINNYQKITEEEAEKYSKTLLELGIENYLANIRTAKQNAIRKYNNYVVFNKDKEIFSPKVKTLK